MSGSQQSGKLSCELKRRLQSLDVIPAGKSAASADAEDRIVAGMTEKTLGETVFLAIELLEGRFPSGIFCGRELARQRGVSDGGIGRVRSGADAALATPHSAG